MIVKDLLKEDDFSIVSGANGLDKEIQGLYIGDLLSWVMAHLHKKAIWITIQSHINVIAVGVLNDAACIILAEKASLDEDAMRKSNEEGLPVLKTKLPAYELAIKLNEIMRQNTEALHSKQDYLEE